jgi:hypothetical protein
MDKQERARQNASRRAARKLYINEYCWNPLPRNIVVHHMDENPYNNALSNLTTMENGNHLLCHRRERLAEGKTDRRLMEELESLLYLFNDNHWTY